MALSRELKRTQAALKLQVQFDLSTGALRDPWLQDGRGADQAAPNQTTFPPGALRLADLGYFSLAVLHELSTAGVYWLSRLHLHTHVFDQAETCLDVLPWLGKQKVCTTHDLPITWGPRTARTPGFGRRALRPRWPNNVVGAAQASQTQMPNAEPAHLALADWTVLVTNVPADVISFEEAPVLLRAQRQVELLFKLEQ